MSELRRLRVDRSLTVEDLAYQAGVSPEQIRNIESGRARRPRVSTLGKLAGVLEVTPSAIDPMQAAA